MIDWVADHRKHHTFTDEEGDPHSPHAGRGAGLRGMRARPVARARGVAVQHPRPGLLETLRAATWWRTRGCAASTAPSRGSRWPRSAIPFLLGFALSGGSWPAALAALLWGGPRADLPGAPHHVDASTRSATSSAAGASTPEDRSTNVFWLALPSLGEAWHHNHHAFPRSAFHGLRWYELDPSGWLILAMARVGLAWDVVRVTPRARARRSWRRRRRRAESGASARSRCRRLGAPTRARARSGRRRANAPVNRPRIRPQLLPRCRVVAAGRPTGRRTTPSSQRSQEAHVLPNPLRRAAMLAGALSLLALTGPSSPRPAPQAKPRRSPRPPARRTR